MNSNTVNKCKPSNDGNVGGAIFCLSNRVSELAKKVSKIEKNQTVDVSEFTNLVEQEQQRATEKENQLEERISEEQNKSQELEGTVEELTANIQQESQDRAAAIEILSQETQEAIQNVINTTNEINTNLAGEIEREQERATLAEQTLAQDISEIQEKIPVEASTNNQLADKEFVENAIAISVSNYRGSKNLVTDLYLTISATHQDIIEALEIAFSDTIDNNDYCFVEIPTTDNNPNQIAITEKYKFKENNWEFEYPLNTSKLTSTQWKALNSEITNLLVDKLTHLPTNYELLQLLSNKVDKTQTINGQKLEGNIDITKNDIGLEKVGNFKAVSTEANQELSNTEKENARANIGAGTSNFSGNYNDLINKPTMPTIDSNMIQLGDIKIIYDQGNNSLVIVKSDEETPANLYVTGTITGTIEGLNPGQGGSSGGDVTWALLASNVDTHPISIKHLDTVIETLTSYTTNGKNYKVQKDSNNHLFVNVPWENAQDYISSTTSQNANTVLSAPNGQNGQPSFRHLQSADIYTHNESTDITNDNLEFLTSYQSNTGFANTSYGNRIYRRPISALWPYINNKLIAAYPILSNGGGSSVSSDNADLLDGLNAIGASTGNIIKQGYINIPSSDEEKWYRIATISKTSVYQKTLLYVAGFYVGTNYSYNCLLEIVTRNNQDHFLKGINGLVGDFPAKNIRLYYNTYNEGFEVCVKFPSSTTENRTISTRVLAEMGRSRQSYDHIVLDNNVIVEPTSGWSYIEMSYKEFQGNSTTSSKLITERTLWGQEFDGTKDISGNMTGVGSISASDNITINKSTNTSSSFIATNNKGSISLMTSTNRGVYDSTNSKWLIATNGTNSWLSCGNVGIGTTTPQKALDISGECQATNFYTTSDRNKKTNIEQVSEHISKFTLKETGKDAYGVIAQEVPEMFRDGKEGSMTVNYNSILCYYISLLENKVQRLEEELIELKYQMNNGNNIN